MSDLDDTIVHLAARLRASGVTRFALELSFGDERDTEPERRRVGFDVTHVDGGLVGEPDYVAEDEEG